MGALRRAGMPQARGCRPRTLAFLRAGPWPSPYNGCGSVVGGSGSTSGILLGSPGLGRSRLPAGDHRLSSPVRDRAAGLSADARTEPYKRARVGGLRTATVLPLAFLGSLFPISFATRTFRLSILTSYWILLSLFSRLMACCQRWVI